MKRSVTQLYRLRFAKKLEIRQRVWKVLCQDFFQKYIDKGDTVCDLGAGYCELINNIKAKRRIAVDINTDTRKYAQHGVEVFIVSSTKMSSQIKVPIDILFASNFLEHLPTKEDLAKTILEVRKILKRGGKFIILMPNIKFVGAAYWDFIDHQLPLTEKAVIEALELSGFRIAELIQKFLPYTTKNRLPKVSLLIKLYLKIRPIHFLLGKQSLIVAAKV